MFQSDIMERSLSMKFTNNKKIVGKKQNLTRYKILSLFSVQSRDYYQPVLVLIQSSNIRHDTNKRSTNRNITINTISVQLWGNDCRKGEEN